MITEHPDNARHDHDLRDHDRPDHDPRKPEHALERLIFFSDAVFAIAITLLIIEIHVPDIPFGSPPIVYINALAQLWSSFLGFFVSFFVIGAFWAGHHRAFALAAHHSERLMLPNLMMLCAIVFMPFSTAFMSANTGMVVPATLYNLTLLVTGLLNVRLVRLVTGPPVVAEGVSPEQIAMTRQRGVAVVLGAASALMLGLVDARFSQLALLSIPLWRLLLQGAAKHRLAHDRPAGTRRAGRGL